MVVRFGTSGNCPNFFKSEFRKSTLNAPEWINSIGLNAYERLMTYGARMKEEDAIELGKRAKGFDVKLSVHAPYYIVFTSEKQRIIANSINEFNKTIYLSGLMGAKRIVFHPGFGRDFNKVIRNLKIIEKDKSKDIKVMPETMGKICQLGDLNEVITICENTECVPCIDFAHLHARTFGGLKEEETFRRIICKIEKRLGKEVVKDLHCHFYPVEFNEKGEKKHRAVTEKDFHPQFKNFVSIIKEFNMTPTLISESFDSQDVGALEMKNMLERIHYI